MMTNSLSKNLDTINYRQFDYDVRLFCIHPDDFHRRPTRYEEIAHDTENLIQTVIRPYIDPGCVNLTEEELVSECRLKIAILFHQEKHVEIPNRVEFFKYLKTTLNNHVKGQVQRHRFTLKRTGIRPPEKGNFLAEHHKPIEISLDDPDSHIQVQENFLDECDASLIEGWHSSLTPLQVLVSSQLSRPNHEAVLLALMDVWSGRTSTVKVKPVHMAMGLGMNTEQFLLIQKQLQHKLDPYLMSQNEDFTWNASKAYLARIFAVEVPPSIEKVVVRRLFSLAARNMVARVNEEVRHHMTVIGARIPVDQGSALSCFGIMHEDQNPKCMGCGIKSACVVETRALGLDKITPHPSLLGARPTRTPTVNHTGSRRNNLPSIPTDDGVSHGHGHGRINERTVEIINFLDANFKRAEQARKNNSDEKIISYALRSGVSKSPILWLEKPLPGAEVSLRFTHPSKAVRDRLTTVGNGHYLPKSMPAKEVIKLIETFTNEKLANEKSKSA